MTSPNRSRANTQPPPQVYARLRLLRTADLLDDTGQREEHSLLERVAGIGYPGCPRAGAIMRYLDGQALEDVRLHAGLERADERQCQCHNDYDLVDLAGIAEAVDLSAL